MSAQPSLNHIPSRLLLQGMPRIQFYKGAPRRQMVDLVILIRQKDLEAANFIEQALAKDSGEPI